MVVGNPLMVGGGDNLKNAYAIILVEYPAGSTCTCSNGAKTLKAGNTYGAWAFGVPSGGDWVVTISANDRPTTSKTIGVVQGSYSYVNMLFKLVLFDGGDNTEATGGWERVSTSGVISSGTLTVDSSNVSYLSASSGTRRGAITQKALPLHNYSNLHIKAYCAVEGASSMNNYRIGITTDKKCADASFVAYKQLPTKSGELIIPLDGLSEGIMYYVCMTNASGTNASIMTECWAE